jgi:hypothetical protein
MTGRSRSFLTNAWEVCRSYLNYDPFAKDGSSRPIGFDIGPSREATPHLPKSFPSAGLLREQMLILCYCLCSKRREACRDVERMSTDGRGLKAETFPGIAYGAG